MTEDPIKDGTNWYQYCGGDPVNFIDLFGQDAKPASTQTPRPTSTPTPTYTPDLTPVPTSTATPTPTPTPTPQPPPPEKPSEYIWPTSGSVNSVYGPRTPPDYTNGKKGSAEHKGIDIGAPKGTPVVASASGTVVDVSEDGINGKKLLLNNQMDLKKFMIT